MDFPRDTPDPKPVIVEASVWTPDHIQNDDEASPL
jgi:hypothetical protein